MSHVNDGEVYTQNEEWNVIPKSESELYPWDASSDVHSGTAVLCRHVCRNETDYQY